MTRNPRPSRFLWLLAPMAALLALTPRVTGQAATPPSGEWRNWGADGATSHYSAIDQIDRTNVKNLKVAWRWKTENFGPRPDFDYKATPLMIGGVLYTTAGSARDVAAIDAKTGQTLWTFHHDEGTRGSRAPNRGPSGRGLSYWTDGRGDDRLIYVSLGYQLIELNPKTGRPITTFGSNGVVELWEGLDQARKPVEGNFSLTSPPSVVKEVIVVGAALGGGNGEGIHRRIPAGLRREDWQTAVGVPHDSQTR